MTNQIRAKDVAKYLRPNGGYVVNGEDFEGIVFIEAEPFSKTEFEAAKPETIKWLADKEKEEADKKSAALDKLAQLGLSIEDLRLLGLG
jgi:hypothetical protein